MTDNQKLTRLSTPLTAPVVVDDILRQALAPFDLDVDLVSSFYPWAVPAGLVPETFGIGLIVGASGTGKSTLLREFGDLTEHSWDRDRAIVSHFGSAGEAATKLAAAGLNSVPTWRQPFHTLSTGQQFRANLARSLESGSIVDEFTSVVDRNVAISASRALRVWVDREGATGIVLASCHRDIASWLQPDWTVDTDSGTFSAGSDAERPSWLGELVTGDEVGRLVIA